MPQLFGVELACIGRRYQAEFGVPPVPEEIADYLKRLHDIEATKQVLRGAQALRVTGYTAESLEAYLILSQQEVLQVLVDVYARAEDRHGGCATRDRRARSGSRRSASPCRSARCMPMCWRIWAIEPWRDPALRDCENRRERREVALHP